MAGLLGVVLAVLFHQSFAPHQILFANDGPLGVLKADCNRLPDRFAGTWRELAWLGNEAPAASPTISTLLQTVLSAETYLKIYAPFTLFFVGFSAWVFFRQLRFNPAVCVLGAVAAGLNMHFVSVACWGLGAWNIAAGAAFLALAALSSKSIKQTWAKAILAGLAVGMGLMEGFDLGAILSICIGVFVVFWALTEGAAPIGQRIVSAVVAEALVIFFAGFIAAHTISSLIQTQIEGVASMEQDVATKQQRWNAATQWSLPKLETLEIFVPGLFGYRLSPNITQPDHSSAYWGLIGQDPRIPLLQSSDVKVRQDTATVIKVSPEMVKALDTDDPQARMTAIVAVTKKAGIYWRYSGSGECAGVLVSLLAIFALANLWRANTPLSKAERLGVGFWGVVALFSVLAAWGRHGFLYRVLYHLPYFSTMRNPIKFLHPFHIAWVILAAYGLEALWRRYLRGPAMSAPSPPTRLQRWWGKVAEFEMKWTVFSLLLVAASVVGFLVLKHSRPVLIPYLESENFPSLLAVQITGFTLSAVVWFIVYLTLSVLVLISILGGAWTGAGAKVAWVFLAALMIGDLARADMPWIRYYDYSEKYSLNPVVDLLQDKPYEHRVIGKLEPRGPGSGITPGFGELYFFWLQNDFPYHNIQSLDFAQAPHLPDLDRNFLKTFELQGTDIHATDLWPAMRLWQLTNTRYVLATANAVDMLNSRVDPSHHSFQIQSFFDVHPKLGAPTPLSDLGDLTVGTGDSKGQFGVIEFTGTLPRAKLYSNWQIPTNDNATLQLLASRSFDPAKTVLLSNENPPSQPPGSPTADPGTVTITRYQPKRVQLQADAKTPAVLLLNDRFATDWKAWVDQKPAPIMRCNYLMRGLFLTPGSHRVDFQFKPSLKTLYVSLCAFGVGLALAGYLVATRSSAPATAAAAPKPSPSPAPPSPAKPNPHSPPANGSGGKRKGNGTKPSRPGQVNPPENS